jgi:hypothetical protein
VPVIAACEQLIVLGLSVTDVGAYSEVDGGSVESLGRGGSTDASTVLPTRVLGDGSLSPDGARWVASPHFHGELLDVGPIGSELLFGASLSSSSACRRILKAGGFSGFEGWSFHEEALALIALSRTAPLQHDGPKGRGAFGTPGERSVSRREKFEVIEISAGQTHGALGLL